MKIKKSKYMYNFVRKKLQDDLMDLLGNKLTKLDI